ncbi:MAG: DUF2779 domain-containing protein [Cyclobacteriaceae bacterium]|nr:DUF2779 domain-containing protein [Cyclobacteriaceae bacterium SS2]
MKPRFLTKSRFKQAIECPTKLYYTGKRDEYGDNSLSDEFLIALAKSGYQVGELAKYYFPGGISIVSLDHQTALDKTNELLKNEDIILYEPAFKYENLFIRVDILIKKGTHVKLIEVKAKSYYSSDEFLTSRGAIPAEWKEYHFDVAFQKYVLTKAFPQFRVEAFLMLTNKNVKASVEGLFQKFLIKENEDGRLHVLARNIEELGQPILTAENIDHIVEKIWNQKQNLANDELSFFEYIHRLADAYENDSKIEVGVTKVCRDCQYKLKSEEEGGLKSGFHECWKSMTNLTSKQLNDPLVIDVWDCRKADSYLKDKIFLQQDINPETLGSISDEHQKSGLQRVERQELQVTKAKLKDDTIHILKDELLFEMNKVTYPLNMIDFETTLVAIPFNKGRRPYESIAFQFSHHTIGDDGKIVHATEWINTSTGRFPNFEFVRALRKALEQNKGSVFRYSHHENTILNKIHDQLKVSEEPDKEMLMGFIETITHRTEGQGNKKVFIWEGDRDMIDMWDWVKRFYYDPRTNGSNSLKAILPSVINRSTLIKDKYSAPIYGASIPSLNFKNKKWIEHDGDELISPYRLLPKLWDRYDRNEVDLLINPTDELEDGGAAMTAYNYMQFPDMSDTERKATVSALLHYCELDTLAMVLLWEGLFDLAN